MILHGAIGSNVMIHMGIGYFCCKILEFLLTVPIKPKKIRLGITFVFNEIYPLTDRTIGTCGNIDS